MDELELISRDQAEVFASWFQALADPTRILVLNYLSHQDAPVGVGAIVEALGLRQSTTSHHLKVLYDVGFLRRQREGASVLYYVNKNCLEKFPSAADMVMGRFRTTITDTTGPAWLAG